MAIPSVDEMKKRFHEAKTELEKAWQEPKLVKLQAEYDALHAEIDALRQKQSELGVKLNLAKNPITELQKEMAFLCRALNGQTAL